MQQAFFLCDITPATPETPETPDVATPLRAWVQIGEHDGQAVIHALVDDDAGAAADPAYLGADYAELWAADQDAALAVLKAEAPDGEVMTLAAMEAAGHPYTLGDVLPPNTWLGVPVALPT